jgi:uncharacterized protein YprB with RNaseH-like and TPR domain
MSDPKDLRKKLDALNRKPVSISGSGADLEEVRRIFGKKRKDKPETASQTGPSAIVYRRDLPRYSPKSGLPRIRTGETIILEEATKGEEIHCRRFGRAYLIRNSVRNSEGDPASISEDFRRDLLEDESPLRAFLCRAFDTGGFGPEDVMFVDIETTGLGGTPVFLVGTMVWEDGGLVVHQYLARDYSEEPGIVARFVDLAGERKLLVTFNGKSFDIPYLRTRAAAVGVPFSVGFAHLDLLHVGRRVWGSKLPDCKLQTLETFICGRVREGDIPGSEIPEAYHEFVRTKNAAQVVEILRHNYLDLVTLAELMTRLSGPDTTSRTYPPQSDGR